MQLCGVISDFSPLLGQLSRGWPSTGSSIRRRARLTEPSSSVTGSQAGFPGSMFPVSNSRPTFFRTTVSLSACPGRPRHPLFSSHRAKNRISPCKAFSSSLAFGPAMDGWVVWAALASAGALGLWSEKTRLGHSLSGALVATLIGLLMSNVGLIPFDAAQYAVVNKMLLPLAIPMLLFSADLRRVFLDTGKLLGVFVVGSVATVIATVLAFKLLPLASLGADGWKVASALCARHIGGAVNYVGVVETLGVSPVSQAAGLAADNLICALYFSTLYWLARGIPADPPGQESVAAAAAGVALPEGGEGTGAASVSAIPVLESATAVAVSTVICAAGSMTATRIGYPGLTIPIITLISVAAATAAPRLLSPLVVAGEGLAAIIMQIFFATVGANGSIAMVIKQAPSLFVFSLVQVSVHLGIVLLGGKLLGYSLRDTLIASNANVGGPTTAAGMAAAKSWRASIVPALLVGTFGYAIATFVSIALGFNVLQPMSPAAPL